MQADSARHTRTIRHAALIAALLLALWPAAAAQAQPQAGRKSEGSEQLGKALEYFSSGKYHEALAGFEKLEKTYGLNDRFRAYMGICYYYVWEYDKACKYLDDVMQSVEVYAPHERSLYYYAAAESHFNLGEYDKAVPLYEKHLVVCYDNEKGDSFYRIGFCRMFGGDWQNAYDSFSSALLYYERFRNTPDLAARITQIRTMLPGILAKAGGVRQ